MTRGDVAAETEGMTGEVGMMTGVVEVVAGMTGDRETGTTEIEVSVQCRVFYLSGNKECSAYNAIMLVRLLDNDDNYCAENVMLNVVSSI